MTATDSQERPHIRKAVIPAAGLGTRLRPATRAQPKEMIPVGRLPTIQYVVEELVTCGIRSILVVTGRRKRSIEDHFDATPNEAGDMPWRNEVDIFFVRQTVQAGLADAVACGEGFVDGEDFVVCLGDTIVDCPQAGSLLSRMLSIFRQREALCTVAAEQVAPADVTRYGILAPDQWDDDAFRVSQVVEKPTLEAAPSRYAIASRYVFSARVFDAIRALRQGPPHPSGECQLTDAIQAFAGEGRVWGVPLRDGEKRYDIGGYDTYYRAFVDLALKDKDFGPGFREYLRAVVDDRLESCGRLSGVASQ